MVEAFRKSKKTIQANATADSSFVKAPKQIH
jgi:hypothetical protein